MIFLPLPIIISFIVNLVLAILILVYAGNIFWTGWPRSDWCPNYHGPPGHPGYPGNPYNDPSKCKHLQVAMKVLMGIGSGLGFLVG
jgi:hypothetical protein